MLRSIWLLLLYLSFLGLGMTAPFVMTLGYVWVDTFRPQEVAYIILNELPVALIMGGGAFVTYFTLDRRSPPPLTMQSVLQITIAVWMTITLLWAVAPERAWVKWDWAFKSVAFAAFVPLVFRSRVQIEAFAQTYVFSLAANFVPFGIKVLISGGGYGRNLGLQGGNSGLAEGGYLSTVCLMAIPLALFLGKHGQLIPRLPMMNLAYIGVAGLALVTAIGTYERSALIGIVALGVYMFFHSRRKFLYVIFAGLITFAIVVGTASSWNARVSTITQYSSESSAMTRIMMWKWAIDFVGSHPFGGSLDSHAVSSIMMPADANNEGGYIQLGRAYHSIYFEIFGDLGYFGLFLFLLCASSSMISLIRLSRKCRKIPDLLWVADMSNAVQSGMLVFLTAGAFVGIAYQPPFWYFVSMGICLRAFVWHAERADVGVLQGWRLAAQQTREAIAQAATSSARRSPSRVTPDGSQLSQGWRAKMQPHRGKS